MSYRYTAADIARLEKRPLSAGAARADGNKFGNRFTNIDGIKFPSALEARLYQEIKLRKAAGEFRPPYFLRQVPFYLPGNVTYRADFVTFPKEGGCEVLDAKGYTTRDGHNKIKQVEALFEIEVILWTDKR